MADYIANMRAARRAAKPSAAGETVPVFYENEDEGLTKRRARVSTDGAQSKGTRRGGQRSKAESKGRTMAAKKKGKGKGKSKSHGKGLGGPLTKAEIKAAGGIPEAWKARRSKKRKGGSKPKTKKPRQAAKTARKSGKGKGRRRSSKRAIRVTTPGRVRSTTTRTIRSNNRTLTQVAIVPVQAHKPARKGRRRSTAVTKAKENPVRHRRHHRRRARESYMMENPLGGAEIFVGGLTAITGFALWDAADRVWASHAVTTGANDASGNPTYTDTAPTTGSYPGLLNGTAILAPFSAMRFANGVVFAALPLIGGHFIKSPMGRSAVQCFGLGALVGFGGKLVQQLVARLTIKTAFGERLYVNEQRALVNKQSQGGGTPMFPVANVASTGLGRQTGVASCCSSCAMGGPCGCVAANKHMVQMGAPPPPPPQPTMVQPPPPPVVTQPPPPPPAPMPQAPPPPANFTPTGPNPSTFNVRPGIQGVPAGLGSNGVRVTLPSRQQMVHLSNVSR